MSNAVVFARALFALYEAGVLAEPECKPAVKTFIRQSSEDRLWNDSTHYRSKNAAVVVERAMRTGTISSASQYHAFCKKKENGLRHEHMVPGEVVYKLILEVERPSVLAYARILHRTGFRATITVVEDKKLLRDSMPPTHADHKARDYYFGRYIHANLRTQLEERRCASWYEQLVAAICTT